MKTLQYFSSEYLESCRQVKSEDILKFLDDFRKLHLSVHKAPFPAGVQASPRPVPPVLLTGYELKAKLRLIN